MTSLKQLISGDGSPKEVKSREELCKEEKYREEQRKRMLGYVVGKNDENGNAISKILIKSDEYVIYETPAQALSDSIIVKTDTFKEVDNKYDKLFGEIRVNYCRVKGLLYKVIDDPSVKSRVAHIIDHAFSTGQTDKANYMFEELIREINRDYADQYRHRLIYLFSGLLVTVALISFAIAVYYNELYSDQLLVRDFVYIVAAGSIGGFLSIAGRLTKTVFEKDVSHLWYVTYGMERIFIAMLGAVIIYFAAKSNVAFGFVNELTNPLYGLVLFAVVAGFSETLVPNLLIKLEKENSTEIKAEKK